MQQDYSQTPQPPINDDDYPNNRPMPPPAPPPPQYNYTPPQYQQPMQYQPPPLYHVPSPMDRRNRFIKIVLIVAASVIGLLIILGIVGAMVSSNSPTATNTAQTNNRMGTEESHTIYIGQSTTLNGVDVSLLSGHQSQGGGYSKPSDGNVFVMLELEITNNTDKDLVVSSLMSFDAYCDDYTLNISMRASMASDSTQLDGTIAPGKKMRGYIGYEVPADWQKIEVMFEPDVWQGEKVTCIALREA